ncbi:hypothetical protein [Enterovibrio norvegicus]|uniref:hypothetical protein n=1 Tax=Enterovibrio norvegicus TaxID=188144 RepID=UPI001303FCB0|nr:hypothetical protein [Enterovibrio norvegicus]
MKASLTASVEGAESPEYKSLRSVYKLLGLSEEHLTKQFTLEGQAFVLSGYKS